VDISSGSLLYECLSPWPSQSLRISPSPDGRELCFTTGYGPLKIGPFILDTQHKRLYEVLAYPVDEIVRSPDGSRLAIGANRDVWIMEIDPNLSTCEALGHAVSEKGIVTCEIQRMTRSIVADPFHPENYLRRSLAFMSLDEREKAESDLGQFDALVTSEDHHVGYEVFWWLKRCYVNTLYDRAELLAPHAEKLMERFPDEVPSYRDLVEDIIKQNERNGKPELAARWRAKLQELDESNK